jgi:hypothetical protein
MLRVHSDTQGPGLSLVTPVTLRSDQETWGCGSFLRHFSIMDNLDHHQLARSQACLWRGLRPNSVEVARITSKMSC